MKTTYNIRQFAVVIILAMVTITAAGQPNARDNRRSNDNNKEISTPQKRSNPARTIDQKARPASSQNNNRAVQNTPNQRNNNRETARNNTYNDNTRNNSTVNHNQNNGKGNNNSVKHNQNNGKGNNNSVKHNQNYGKGNNSTAHVKQNYNHHTQPVVYHKPPHRNVYYRHLPTQRVNRFHYHGHDYIYSNNYFYRYHPHRGYIVADFPFVRVRHLPPRYYVRVYNGHPYIYYNGFIFLPHEAGYVMIPQPARPNVSLNIVLNW